MRLEINLSTRGYSCNLATLKLDPDGSTVFLMVDDGSNLTVAYLDNIDGLIAALKAVKKERTRLLNKPGAETDKWYTEYVSSQIDPPFTVTQE